MTSGKKPVLRGILLIVIVCGIAAVCLLTRPKPERYTFRIIIPAGTQERFVYSEEEFRATKYTVRIWLNGGLEDTEVLLTPVEETMETGYTAAYLTQGMPAEFDADKRIWFRVGVKAQNTTDEDITAYLTVENAEIRGRSSDENSPDSITFEAEILEIRDGYFLVKPEAGWAINSAMILLAAATFFVTKTPVEELQQADSLLQPLLGRSATHIFAVALLFAGISSTITSGMAAGSIFAGIFKEPYDIRDNHSRTGVMVSLVAAFLIILLIGDPFKGLIYSQMILSIQLPFTVFLQVHLTSSERVMGKYRNSRFTKYLLYGIGAVVTVLNVMLLVSFFR